MRFNEKELVSIAAQPGDKEGRLYYKSPGTFREGCKERWFKLKGNMLFYFRLSDIGVVNEIEPIGVIIMEHCRIQQEMFSGLPNAFSITFANDLERRHYFGCQNVKHTEDWIKYLKSCSYEYQRELLTTLQGQISQLTGKDPLDSLSAPKKEVKEEDDSDAYFSHVHLFSRTNGEFTSLI